MDVRRLEGELNRVKRYVSTFNANDKNLLEKIDHVIRDFVSIKGLFVPGDFNSNNSYGLNSDQQKAISDELAELEMQNELHGL